MTARSSTSCPTTSRATRSLRSRPACDRHPAPAASNDPGEDTPPSRECVDEREGDTAPTASVTLRHWRMAWCRAVRIRAVFFDIGGVLERVGPPLWTQTWRARLGLGEPEFDAAVSQVDPQGLA